jgi:23S rRNA G2445 N2-methylase RlmL
MVTNRASAYAATNRSASRGEIARHTRALQDTVARAVKEATEEQRSAERLAIDCQQRLVKDADDGCAGMAAMEAEKQSDASEELRAKCEIANETLATYSQARITMGNVTVDATSENQSGLSAAIIDKVSWFKIGNVSVSNNSKNKCGIW